MFQIGEEEGEDKAEDVHEVETFTNKAFNDDDEA